MHRLYSISKSMSKWYKPSCSFGLLWQPWKVKTSEWGTKEWENVGKWVSLSTTGTNACQCHRTIDERHFSPLAMCFTQDKHYFLLYLLHRTRGFHIHTSQTRCSKIFWKTHKLLSPYLKNVALLNNMILVTMQSNTEDNYSCVNIQYISTLIRQNK